MDGCQPVHERRRAAHHLALKAKSIQASSGKVRGTSWAKGAIAARALVIY
jgi:hypothetical protein